MVDNKLIMRYLIDLRDDLDQLIEWLEDGRVEDQEKNNVIEHASQIGQRITWIREKIQCPPQ